MAAIAQGNKIYFAGGNKWNGAASARVDIYDNATDSWSTATLSEARTVISGTSVGNKIIFAGGNGLASPSAKVDIYDTSTNNWTTSALIQARKRPTAITLGNKAFFAGGNVGTAQYLSPVDIYDNSTQSTSSTNIHFGSMFFNAVAQGSKILFFTLVNAHWVNVYNGSNNSWSIAYLDQRIINPAVVAAGNQVYIAGGTLDDGTQSQTNKVWKLRF